MAGFGNVNRALVRLLARKQQELRALGIDYRVTGVGSRRLGWIADPEGLDLAAIEAGSSQRSRLAPHASELCKWLGTAKADVLFEATSLSVKDGQPAIAYIRAALESGAHAITANKGPVIHAYRELTELAAAKRRRFLFESAVMDGVPIFSLFRENLPAVQLRGFHGILNSTTNLILTGMEQGLTFEQSLSRAQQLGIAETDASHDIDGWDAAVKVAALVTVLMGIQMRPEAVKRQGIATLAAAAVRQARAEGKPFKLVCRAHRAGTDVEASVGPEQVPLTDPLALVNGTSSMICFETDIFPALTITENDPGVETTAYGMLADFVRAVGD